MISHLSLDPWIVDQYYTHIEKGLNPKEVVGGPVTDTGTNTHIGTVGSYNKKTGMILIDLINPVYYKSLLQSNVPLKNIIFRAKA